MQYILFTKEGDFKTIAADAKILDPKNDSFVIEVEDDFEYIGFNIRHVDGVVVKEPENDSLLLTSKDIDLDNLRLERNRLIAFTDWTQNEDIPQQTRDIWKPYRQSLRDITERYKNLEEAVFPTKPDQV